jgi:hypothetical protein
LGLNHAHRFPELVDSSPVPKSKALEAVEQNALTFSNQRTFGCKCVAFAFVSALGFSLEFNFWAYSFNCLFNSFRVSIKVVSWVCRACLSLFCFKGVGVFGATAVQEK